MGPVSENVRAPASRPPSRWLDRLSSLRRDAVTVLRDLAGSSPAPFTYRQALGRHAAEPQRPPADLLASRSLRVERVVRETTDVVSLHLVDPTGAPLAFTPGQFLTLVTTLPGGQSRKRAYSLSVVPGKGEGASRSRITIKRVAQGEVSNHLNDAAAEGDVLTVLGPSGNFGISAEDAAGKHLLLIGGGSGITPLRSIVEARLSDPSVTATLLYGNRTEKDVIFRAELDELARRFEGRLAVRHVLEAPPAGWTGGAGRLDRTVARQEIEGILASGLARDRRTEALVCGPTPMMDSAREVLLALGLAGGQIREEQFSSPDRRKLAAPTTSQPIHITLRGKPRETVAAAGQTLLEAGLSAGVDMPFSCAMGGCGACRVKLVSGQVVSEEPNCLSAAEARQGFVLACVSRATCPVAVEVP